MKGDGIAGWRLADGGDAGRAGKERRDGRVAGNRRRRRRHELQREAGKDGAVGVLDDGVERKRIVRIDRSAVPSVKPGALRAMETGGQVEKKPAELPALERFAVMMVDPGACAVATPFWSMVTMDAVCGV